MENEGPFKEIGFFAEKSVPFEDIFKVFLVVEQVTKEFGLNSGYGIVELDVFKTLDSEFEQHEGTPFATYDLETRESQISRDVTRISVYETLEKFANDGCFGIMAADLDSRFPIDKFGDVFPLRSSIEILIGRYSPSGYFKNIDLS